MSFVDAKVKEVNDRNLNIVATKQDIANTNQKIADSKIEIMRWMFGVFAMLMLAIIGLYFKR